MKNEKLMMHFGHRKTYNNTDLNVIGASNSLTLRTLETISGDTAYVRKFGTDYNITQVTDIEDPIDVNMTFTVKALDGTVLGSRVGGGAFVSGSTVTAQGCYLEILASGGAVTVLSSITIDTNIDVGGLAFVCPAESVADGDTLTLYLSDTGSTYYDSAYMYGGARHIPILGTERKPYFTIGGGYTALNSANDGVVVLDSCIYDEELTFDRADTVVQSALGQTPKITSGIGARVTREVSTQYNNTSAIYFNKNGDDADSGSWQEPKLTIANAVTNRGAKDVVYGGDNCGGSDEYLETATIAAIFNFECDYGYIAKIKNVSTDMLMNVSGNVQGFRFEGSTILIGITCCDTCLITISGCDFKGFSEGVRLQKDWAGNINQCIFDDNITAIKAYPIILKDFNGIVQKCIIKNNQNGIYIIDAEIIGMDIQNNVIYDNSLEGIYIHGNTVNGIIRNNTIFQNKWGLHIIGWVVTPTIKNNIIYDNTSWDLYKNAGLVVNITYTDYKTNSGFTIGAGCITTDPEFMKAALVYNFALQVGSPCYRTDTSSDDMGAHLRNIVIAESNITINGFIIDGQSQYNNAISIIDTDNDTGLSLKWCTIENYQGIAIDLYDDDTDTDAEIKNCLIQNNGNGINFVYGGNTVEESLVYNNTVFGIHADYTNQTFNHNVFYGNQHGLYFGSNTTGINIKNCISHLNSLYGIYSEVSIIITYCCITDATNNVDMSDSSNLINNPLFVNAILGNEDFHIKTIEGGFQYDSACKNSADDGLDIGMYEMNRSLASELWKMFQLYNNPLSLNPFLKLKGKVDFEDVFGGGDKFGKAHKNIFPLSWDDNDDQTENQMDMLKYISTLVKTRENAIDEAMTDIRFHILPSQKLLTGTSGAVSGVELTDSTLDLSPNKYKGWHLGIKFEAGFGMVIDGSANTGTKAGAGWTINQWNGYYIYYNYHYYLILSNTATVLTLSDVDNTLVSATISYSIEKYFKILKHDKTIFTLEDDNNELIDDTYDYYIDFILCRVDNNDFKPKQEGYFFQRQQSKTGFKLTLEEK